MRTSESRTRYRRCGACFLDMFHDCPDDGRFAVGDAIDIDFDCIFEKAIDEHWTIGRHFDGARHIAPKISLVIDKFHGTPTENERGSHQNWVTNFLRDLDSPFGTRRRSVRSLPQTELVQHGSE